MVEDCRDYLRTGRCKYGASCKYNHPSNVQSGGGMKAPVNPGEPMFPLRPAEPICQYYMKHGTCKFGQACKFNHPPPLHHSQHGQSLHALMGGAASGGGSNGSGRTGFSGPTTMLMSLGGQHHHAMVADQGGTGVGAPHSLLCNPIGTDPASGSMILQFLPQRPDEPDCIYFLKNGRCKYGATCRYHHPIAYQPNSSSSGRNQQHQQQRLVIDDPPRRLPPMHSQPVRMVSGGGGAGINSSRGGSPPDSSSYRAHSGHYVNQMIPAYMTQSSSSSSLAGGGGGGVGTNDVQYLNYDTLSSSPLQPVPVVSMDGTTSYAYPIATAASSSAAMNHGSNDHNSSASSLASSYETAGSSLEHLQQQQQQHLQQHQQHGDAMASAALWNRARRNGSGGSLNAYYHDGGGGGTTNARMVSASAKSMPHSASDGNIVGRRNRSTSYGSTSDASYYDAASTATLSRTPSVGSWRNSNSNSDPSVASMARGGGGGAGGGRSIPTAHYTTAAHDAGDYSNASPTSHRQQQQQQQRFAVMVPPGAAAGVRFRRSPRGGPGGNRRGENDEGFTMMTSALLNMLDAPEELVGYDHEGEEDDEDEFDGEDPHMYYEAAAYPQSAILSQQDLHAMPSDSFDPEFFERLSLSRNASYGVPDRNGGHDGPSWTPDFRDAGGAMSNGTSHNPPHALRQGNDDAMQRVIHQHAAAATSTPTHGPTSHGGNGGGGDYGIFLS
jgi:Zinc finger C-x8-C-x5-C-x3-H type (and similar)